VIAEELGRAAKLRGATAWDQSLKYTKVLNGEYETSPAVILLQFLSDLSGVLLAGCQDS
jgi:hypothetical protein